MIPVTRINPWILILRGILILGIGIYILTNPEVTLIALTRLIGVLFLIAGGFLLFSAWYNRDEPDKLQMTEGIITVGLGALFAMFPGALANVFIVLLGVITFLSGLIGIWRHIRTRVKLTNSGFIRNIILLLFGIFLLVNPVEGREAIAIIIGVFATLFGIVYLYGAYKTFTSEKIV